MMKLNRRKWVAIFALGIAGIMLWLERDQLSRGSGESWFWIIVAVLAGVLAVLELIGFGTRHSEDQSSPK